MTGGGDEIPGFHLCRHGLDHGGGICARDHHPLLGDIGVSVKQEAKNLSRRDPVPEKTTTEWQGAQPSGYAPSFRSVSSV
jgi:hypothetical protein